MDLKIMEKPVELDLLRDLGARKYFPILQRKMNDKPLVFLDSAASSQKPLAVIEAMERYYSYHHANIHRGVYGLSQEATQMFEDARQAVADFIHAGNTSEIIFTKGTTESINLVAQCLGELLLKPGDGILLSYMEHHSNIVPWQFAAAKKNAKIHVVGLTDDGQLDMEEFDQLITQNIKIVALTHVSNALGTINPVKEIISKAHRQGAVVLIDGAQAAPHFRIDVQKLDADFYVFSGHKMYGPTGIGVLYGKEQWLDIMPPYQGGGEMIQQVSFEKTTYNELPFKFEAGTPPICGAIGLHAALQFLGALDVNVVEQYEHKLVNYALEALSEIEGFRLIGNAPQRAGVISFLLGDHHPYDVGVLLDKMGIAVRTGHHCTQPLMEFLKIPGTVRASFALYNDFQDIDKLCIALNKAMKML